MNLFQYTNREERARFVVSNFADFLRGRILDVGCWERDLLRQLPTGTEYVGVDIGGTPDIKLDLEKDHLSFTDNSFGCVVCTDVLEHIDNLHEVFGKMLAITDRYVIISLPNSWLYLKNILLSRNQLNRLKYYGLPLTKPEDRHKWFFNFSDTEYFFTENAKIMNYRIVFLEPYFYTTSNLKKKIKNLAKKILGRSLYNNLFSTAIWVVLEKIK